MIERINKIKNHRIFLEFNWGENLPDFKKKNIIYGWNGSGKSTLSNIFRSLEKKENLTEGEVEFLISGKTVKGIEISSFKEIPNIKVFNTDFVNDNVFTYNKTVNPIFFFLVKSTSKSKK